MFSLNRNRIIDCRNHLWISYLFFLFFFNSQVTLIGLILHVPHNLFGFCKIDPAWPLVLNVRYINEVPLSKYIDIDHFVQTTNPSRAKWALVCIKTEDSPFYDWYRPTNSATGGNIDNVIINFYWTTVVANCWYCECMIYKTGVRYKEKSKILLTTEMYLILQNRHTCKIRR